MVDDCAAVLNDGLAVCGFSVLFLTSLLPLLRPVLFTFDVVAAELDTLDLLLDPLLVVVVVLVRSSRLPMLFPKSKKCILYDIMYLIKHLNVAIVTNKFIFD